MPRPARLQVPGAIYHVSSRAVAGRSLFEGNADWELFLKLFAKVVDRHDWVCGLYCLMSSHYHLVIRTPNADLARGMQLLNSCCYAQEFNRRHGLEGHAFLRRYHSVMIEREGHLFELSRYLPWNPVRAGLCVRPEDWLWSSYPALRLCPSPSFLSPRWFLELFGRDRERARQRLRAFVEDMP